MTAVDDGAQALEWLDANPRPDVVLCDLIMPGLSGMEVFARTEDRHPEVADRFVFITGGATSEEAVRFVKEHRDRVVEKPLDLEELRELVCRPRPW